jgi:hypothetical protein
MNNERLYPTFAEQKEILEIKKRFDLRDSTKPSTDEQRNTEGKKASQPPIDK